MTLTENLYEEQLRELVRGSVWFMQILRAVRYCDPPNWLVGGGVIRNLVWNRAHGYAVPPLSSSEEGVGANPETATSVGVRLLADDELYIVAPLGLDNLFELVLRRNPRRVTPEIFRKRLVDKGIREKWPKVRIVDEAHMKVS